MIQQLGAANYIDIPALISVGVDENTLKTGMYRFRTGETPLYKHISHPKDRRKKLLDCAFLPDWLQSKVTDHFGDPKQLNIAQQLKDLLHTDSSAITFFSNYRPADGDSLDPDYINKYVLAAQWLNLLRDADKCKHFKKQFGTTRDEFYRQVTTIFKNENISLPTSYPKLRAKVREYKLQGYTALISKKFGNKNSAKISDEQHTYIRMLYANPEQPQKLLPAQITWLYNQRAVEVGWECVTEQTIYNYISDPATQALCWKERNGKGAWRNIFDPVINRSRPTYGDDLWVLDGTPFELYYLENKKARRMYVYFVVDACSWKVLGWDISESETSDVVMNALKMACCVNGRLPHQLQYDNSSANKSCEFLFASIAKVCTPAGVGNARAKIIEPVSKHINEQILKWYPNYSGANITARKADSHSNRDLIQKQIKSLPSRDEVLDQISQAFIQWNLTERVNGKSPEELYAVPSPRVRNLEMQDRLLLFGVQRKKLHTYTNEGIALTIGTDRHLFHVEDEDWYLANIRSKFRVKYDPKDLSMIALYREDNRFVTFAWAKELVPMAIVDQDEKSRANYNRQMKFKKNIAARVEEGINRDTELIMAETDLKLPISPNHRFKDIENAAKQRMKQLEELGYIKKQKHYEEEETEDPFSDIYGGRRGSLKPLNNADETENF